MATCLRESSNAVIVTSQSLHNIPRLKMRTPRDSTDNYPMCHGRFLVYYKVPYCIKHLHRT